MVSTDSDSEVVCKVIYGLESINLPDTEISLPCIGEKDERDLALL